MRLLCDIRSPPVCCTENVINMSSLVGNIIRNIFTILYAHSNVSRVEHGHSMTLSTRCCLVQGWDIVCYQEPPVCFAQNVIIYYMRNIDAILYVHRNVSEAEHGHSMTLWYTWCYWSNRWLRLLCAIGNPLSVVPSPSLYNLKIFTISYMYTVMCPKQNIAWFFVCVWLCWDVYTATW